MHFPSIFAKVFAENVCGTVQYVAGFFEISAMKKNLVVLTGAGISAESGVSTFRDAGGLWEGHNIMEVASPEGFARNPALVLDFYNQRRRQLKEVNPNEAHYALAALEKWFQVSIITQNVDDLHERSGSTNIIHLHGELRKARSVDDDAYIVDWFEDLNLGDVDPNGHQLRPHIVWFGEMVPMMEVAASVASKADLFVVIGTSMQVYPAAGLIYEVPAGIPVFYIDPNPDNWNSSVGTVIAEKAVRGMQILTEKLQQFL